MFGAAGTTQTKRGIWTIQEGEAEQPVLLGYEVGGAWQRIPLPDLSGRRVALAGDQLVVYPGSHESVGSVPDRLFDPEAGAWSELPSDPIGSSYDRTIVGVDDGVILFAIPKSDVPPNRPRVFHAARYGFATREWRLLAPSSIPGYANAWYRSGQKIINPTLGSVDGGEVNAFDRPYELGGVLVDEANWMRLPAFRELPVGSGSSPIAGSERWVVVSIGAADTPLAILNLENLKWGEAPATALASRTGVGSVVVDDRLLLWGGADFDLPAPRGRLHNDGQILTLS